MTMFQAHIDRMSGYVAGEQPQGGGFVKLNTNENPYPPSPKVLAAIVQAAGERLRLYPDPMGNAFRRAAARVHDVPPEMILTGNGSDDLLTIITRSFAGPGDVVAYPNPSYILYRTLAELQNAQAVEVPFRDDWTLDPQAFAAHRPKLAFLANPNSPSGTILPAEAVAELAKNLDCPLVVDEAYVDFADTNCLRLAVELPNVIVLRTLSKGYSLAGLRFGYLIAQPQIIEGLVKVKDSYNCDALSLAGAVAAIEDADYYQKVWRDVRATRDRLASAMRNHGCRVPESQANFIWCVGGLASSQTYEALKARKVLVRLMRYSGRPEGLRITAGTESEIDCLLETINSLR